MWFAVLATLASVVLFYLSDRQQRWLKQSLPAMVRLLAVLLLVWVLFSRLQAMTQTLRSVTSDYRIVHREQLVEQK